MFLNKRKQITILTDGWDVTDMQNKRGIIKFIRNHRGVSHVMGYYFVIVIAFVVMSATTFTVNLHIDNKKKEVGRELALDVANYVADTIVDGVTMKLSLPNANFERILEVPQDLAGRSYYIEVTESAVYVNSTDGSVSRRATNYNAENLNVGISGPLNPGRIYPANGKIKVFCEETEFVHRFDFGTTDSPLEPGYQRVSSDTDGTFNTRWHDYSRRYRIPITINNYVSEDEFEAPRDLTAQNLTDFQCPITLYPAIFDYNKALHNGSDLRFFNSTNVSRPFWIEHWNPGGVSRVWVNFGNITYNTTETVYMYFGNSTDFSDPDPHSSDAAKDVFVFFDDFDELDTDIWNCSSFPYDEPEIPPGESYVRLNGYTNTGCGMLTKRATCNLTNYNNDQFSQNQHPRSNYIKYTCYIVEAKITLVVWEGESSGDPTNANVIVLSQYDSNEKFVTIQDILGNSYSILSETEGSLGFASTKRNTAYLPPPFYLVLNSSTVKTPRTNYTHPQLPPSLDNWSLVRTSIIIGTSWNASVPANPQSSNFTYIGAARYNLSTYDTYIEPVFLEDIIDDDTDLDDDAVGSPYREGGIGFSCNNPSEGAWHPSYLCVDWVRVYQYLLYDLNVTFGELESTNYNWTRTDTPSAFDRGGHTDLVRDFNYNDLGIPGRFEIHNLSAGTYSITITMGDNETDVGPIFDPTLPTPRHTGINIDVSFDGIIFIRVVEDLDLKLGEYKTLWFTINKGTDKDESLRIEIEIPDPGYYPIPLPIWVINTMTIERGVKGVKVEEYYE